MNAVETMKTILSRKSVRSYTGEKPPKLSVNAILTAAQAAPVGMGRYDTVCLTVIENPEILNELTENLKDVNNRPIASAVYGAPILILVSAKPDGDAPTIAEYSNAAVIVENMALAATDMGVGCCHIWGAIMALSENPELVKKLELPTGFTPICGLAIGETYEAYSERDIPDDRIAVRILK